MPNPGYLTPSTFGDLMSNGRGSEEMGKTALKVVDLLVMDILGVERSERDSNPISCQWGIDHEWEAIQAYEDRTFRIVHPAKFKVCPTCEYVGGTMDGLVGKSGGIEVKCPFNSGEHLDNLKDAKQFKTTYQWQLQGYFWIYELDWIDCISYDPRFPEPSNLTIYRAYPVEDALVRLKERCELAYMMAQKKAELLQ